MNKYLVGGAVRDLLMGRVPNDKDYVVVGETVESMLAVGFEQVGKDFPVFLHPETGDEHALARKERKTDIGYNGFETSVENVTLEEDLARRDFTINAMALDGDKVIDPFNGQQDIKNKVIRHITGAFKEDPLRVLRAARFAARYGFTIAPETVIEMQAVSDEELNSIPVERIWAELEKAHESKVLDKFIDTLFVTKRTSTLARIFGFENENTDTDNRFAFISSEKAIAAPTFEVALQGIALILVCLNRITVPSIRFKPYVDRAKLFVDADRAFSSLLGASTNSIKTEVDILVKAREAIVRVATRLGALNETPAWREMQDALRLTDFNIDWFIRSVEAMKLVTAAQFPNLQGKELGVAIMNARARCVVTHEQINY